MSTIDLLRQVRERPDDDAPRLAFADAVEASDPERAEFIRLSLRLHEMPHWHPDWHETWLRANEVQARNLARWLTGHTSGEGLSWHFERGFPDVVAFASQKAMRQYALTDGEPGPPRARVHSWRHPVGLASVPALAAFRELGIENRNLGDADVAALAASPHLGPLTHLELSFRQLSDDGLIALASCERLGGLRDLRLLSVWGRGTHFTARGVEALAASPHLRSLEGLALRGCGLDDAVRALWRSPVAGRLRRLDLSDNAITAAGLDGLPPLRRLNLANNRVADVTAIVRHPGLEWLDLSNNALDDAAAEELAGSPAMRSLEGLGVQHNLIGDAGLLALGRSRTLAALTAFVGQGNPVRGTLVAAVAERFTSGGPPLTDAPVAARVAAEVAPVGTADEDGLVRAVVSDPDDALRGVYADWLEEHGAAELAELMRLEDAPLTLGTEDRQRLVRQQLKDAADADLVFDRGLPLARVAVRQALTKAFDATVRGWRRYHLHGLHLSGRASDWSRLARVSAFAYVRGLSLYGMQLGDDGAAKLAASPHLSGLIDLDLHGNGLGPRGLAALFGGGRLAGLCRLHLGANHPGPDGLRSIAESPTAGGLVRLNLSNSYPTRAGVAVLADSPRLTSLRWLALLNNQLDDESVRLLAESPHLPALEALDLSANRFTPAGVEALIGSALLARLRWLALEYIELSDVPRLARALSPGCRLKLSRYNTPADERAAVDEILGDRVTWT